MTALRASLDDDLVVAVFEKSTREGCNAAISSGSLAAGGTRFQRAAGIEDSPQRHADDILAASGDEEWRPVVEALCAVAPDVVEWIADTGYPIEIGADMPRAGMSVPRLHTDVGRLGGGRLVRHLRDLLAARPNVAFVDEAPVVGLLTSTSGVDRAGRRAERRARGGPGRARPCWPPTASPANPRLMAEHLAAPRRPVPRRRRRPAPATRCAWLTELGAQFRNMGAALRSGLVVVGHGTRVSPALQFNGAVLLDTARASASSTRRRTATPRWPASCSAARRAGRDGVGRDRHGRDRGVGDDARVPRGRRDRRRRDRCPTSRDRLGVGRRRRRAVARAAARPPTPGGAVPPGLGDPRRPHDAGRRRHRPRAVASSTRAASRSRGLYAAGGTACGLAGPSSDGYSSGNGLLSAFGMGWIIGNGLAAPSRTGPPLSRSGHEHLSHAGRAGLL